mgnify:CR=1 FL=1
MLSWDSLSEGILFSLAHESSMFFSAHRKRTSAETDSLEATIAADIERVAVTVGQTIADAGVKASDITAVFLTGGSTAIPLARQRILGLVPQASVIEGDMFGSVGLGLALDAQRKFC